MNIKDSNKHFEKLAGFYSQVSIDGELNKIELDLLKSYTLNFYESITANPRQIVEKPQEIQQIINKNVVANPEPAAVKLSKVTSQAIAEQAPSENIKPESVPKPEELSSLDLNGLFSLATGNEISDKLSMSPIKDVAKAMNINERIFTIKELFGGNKESFDNTMSKLNGFSNYDEAKIYLSKEIVKTYDWLEPSRAKKVKTFLKLLARKYV